MLEQDEPAHIVNTVSMADSERNRTQHLKRPENDRLRRTPVLGLVGGSN